MEDWVNVLLLTLEVGMSWGPEPMIEVAYKG